MKCAKLILILLILPLLANASEKATEKGEQTFRMLDVPKISINNDEGNIEVASWDKKDVKLAWTKIAYANNKKEAEILLKDTDIDIFHSPNSLRVKVFKAERSRHFSFWDLFDPDSWIKMRYSVIVHFKLTVPRNVKLRLLSDEGDISIYDCTGEIEASADEGNVKCENIGGDRIYFEVDEGSISAINIDATNGTGKFKTDEGDIRLENMKFRRVDFKCDEGNITCRNFFAENSSFKTDEGDVTLYFPGKKFDYCRISTDEGNVTLLLPGTFSCKFDLKTLEGRIRSDFDLKIEKLGDGQRCIDIKGPLPFSRIAASALEGNIYIREK